ncbi:MAG TPA: hypothetical protein VG222_14710, partial [Vicinamibacterales bacterium]|nr:hypothetical protein [Vicinamibacterales bacterium]
MERLTFNTASSRRGGEAIVAGRFRGRRSAAVSAPAPALPQRPARERYDADYLWMILFTALL